MRQIVQNYKTGALKIEEVPEPALKSGGVLVETYHSVISAGTEKMKIDDSRRSYLGMAKARPEKFRQVLETLKQQGPLATYRKVMNRLDSFTPLGYSLSGKVIAVGAGSSEFKVGDMVACGGAENANHAEVNWVPVNLCTKIPNVSAREPSVANNCLPTDHAAMATIGAIAMQGVRQAGISVGESVGVIGLGLIGLVSCLILKASGCKVMGVDIDPRKVALALEIGVDCAVEASAGNLEQMALTVSGGYGLDAVMVTTGTKSNAPIVTAGKIARDRATIVDVGINRMDIPWQLYYSKELVLKQSRSYGPGRYDPNYELLGNDYPIGYVRWTEKRNMISFLEMMACGRIDVTPLMTHRFDFNQALEAYNLIGKGGNGLYVGIVLEYDAAKGIAKRNTVKTVMTRPTIPSSAVAIGMIGAGNFARTMLLPHLRRNSVALVGVATATGISAKDTARKFGFNFCSTDYREIIENNNINTILIATRHNLHAKLVVEALKAGKHVYTEKPLCITEEELAEICEVHYNGMAIPGASGESHAGHPTPVLMVGFNRRYAPMVKEMKTFFGRRREPMIMYYRVNAGFKDKNDWYQNPQIGGGRLVGEVCHFIDTLQFLTESLPVSVFAQTIVSDNQAITPEDNVLINIRFCDGSIGCINYLANGNPGFSKEYVEVFCEGNVAVLDNFARLTTMHDGKRRTSKTIAIDKGHKGEMDAMITAILNATMPISFESLWATTYTTFKIRESIQKGEPLQISNGPWQTAGRLETEEAEPIANK